MGPKPERLLCSSTRWTARGRCLSTTTTQSCTKRSFSARVLTIPLMLILTYWVACARSFPHLCLLGPDPVPAQCHSEGVVEYYIPERKGCAQAKDTRQTWGHSLLATELSVSLQTIGLCVAHLLLQWLFTCFLLWKLQTAQYLGAAAQGIVCLGRKRVKFGTPEQLTSKLFYSYANAIVFIHLQNDHYLLIINYVLGILLRSLLRDI